MSAEDFVKIENLTFSRDERIIYDDISLTVPRGKVVAVMGPSGIGKTTLLRLIGGQLKPDSGQIYFDPAFNQPTLSQGVGLSGKRSDGRCVSGRSGAISDAPDRTGRHRWTGRHP